MEVHQLRYFLAVARCRSFTRAAEHEHVAQPSLSQQIRKLEDELNTRLFNRLGRTITLTAFGERFQNHARRALAELEGARHEVAALMGLRRGSVVVGAIPTVAPYLLPKALTAFARACPSVTVTVHEDLTSSLAAQLADGALDLALLSLPLAGAEFISTPLLDDPMLLAVPAQHRLGRRRSRTVSARDVAAESLLLLKDGHCFRDDVLGICKWSRRKPKVVFEGGQLATLVPLVEAGAGITLLPKMACRHYRRAGVRLLEFAPPVPSRRIGIVRLKDKFLTPATQAFIDTLRRAFA
jgi:LysR family transcriptional regulator, hydrogen peroxide-inducible genes activator